MNVLFEEDGAFKAGAVLADNATSLQVETHTGKRVKVKIANVLLRFAVPAPGELLDLAEAAPQRGGAGRAGEKEAAGTGHRAHGRRAQVGRAAGRVRANAEAVALQ